LLEGRVRLVEAAAVVQHVAALQQLEQTVGTALASLDVASAACQSLVVSCERSSRFEAT